MVITIETIAPIRVAFVRHTGPYSECGKAWDKLCSYLGKEGLLGPGTRFFGVSYDDPESVPADKVRYDACVEVDESFVPSDGIGVQTIAGGDYARLTHIGPYEKLSQSYGLILGQWLPRQDRLLRNAPSIELYLNSPDSTNPEDLITDIHVPLEKQRSS